MGLRPFKCSIDCACWIISQWFSKNRNYLTKKWSLYYFREINTLPFKSKSSLYFIRKTITISYHTTSYYSSLIILKPIWSLQVGTQVPIHLIYSSIHCIKSNWAAIYFTYVVSLEFILLLSKTSIFFFQQQPCSRTCLSPSYKRIIFPLLIVDCVVVIYFLSMFLYKAYSLKHNNTHKWITQFRWNTTI